MRRRFVYVVVAALGFVTGIAAPALSAARYGTLVTYWGPALVNGSYWCGKVQAAIYDAADYPPNGAATSWSFAYYGSNCNNLHNVPASYLGAQVHLVKSDGTLCGSTPWSWNTASSNNYPSTKALTPSTSCPAHASYKSEAHAEHWDPNISNYRISSWYNSPWLTF